MKRILGILLAMVVTLPLALMPTAVIANHGNVTVFTAGVNDNFAPPTEPTSPSADLLRLMDPYGGGDRVSFPHRQFDDVIRDRVFGHTFTNLPPCIVAATLEIRMLWGGGNDELYLELTGINISDTSSYWGISLSNLAGWSLGSTHTFTFDLANLPPFGPYPTNIIPFMNADNALDVYVQDDTGVDYMILTVTHGCHVDIDIKPGSYPNSINPKSKGLIPVAILTTRAFDAATVDPQTVRFGPKHAVPVRHSLEDVDGDGDIDMILHFRTEETGIAQGDTFATLTGKTYGGTFIAGTDSVRTVDK